MTYIILVAGKGTRLQPLTLSCPKTLYKLDKETSIIQRMVKKIRQYDKQAEIVVVVGFMAAAVQKDLEQQQVIFVHNPYFAVTNSLSSLWFAREYLNRENVVIIDGDIVLDNRLMRDIVCVPTEKPYVLVDSSCSDDGDYNVQVRGEKVLVMSKQLKSFFGEYVCLTKLDGISARLLREQTEKMVTDELYDQLFESALVQMIFEEDFELYYKDIKGYRWTEVDCVDDLILAKQIHQESEAELC